MKVTTLDPVATTMETPVFATGPTALAPIRQQRMERWDIEEEFGRLHMLGEVIVARLHALGLTEPTKPGILSVEPAFAGVRHVRRWGREWLAAPLAVYEKLYEQQYHRKPPIPRANWEQMVACSDALTEMGVPVAQWYVLWETRPAIAEEAMQRGYLLPGDVRHFTNRREQLQQMWQAGKPYIMQALRFAGVMLGLAVGAAILIAAVAAIVMAIMAILSFLVWGLVGAVAVAAAAHGDPVLAAAITKSGELDLEAIEAGEQGPMTLFVGLSAWDD